MASSLEIFKNKKSYTLLNPRLEKSLQNKLIKATESLDLQDHIWLMTSGTENSKPDFVKMVALSKNAFRISAQSVCSTFAIGPKDSYFNTLPYFHVGGLSTTARSLVSGCQFFEDESLQSSGVVLPKWNVEQFVQALQKFQITITSLVPTQIFDLVVSRIPAPSSLRLVFVGGGSLSSTLQQSAEALGWKLIPTYGMTETAAMMAHGDSNESYELFPHILNIRTDAKGCLLIQSPVLLTGYLFVGLNDQPNEFKDPKVDGWFTSSDKAKISGRTLQILGRDSELVKIKGESVSLLKINERLQSLCTRFSFSKKAIVLAVSDLRDGYQLCLVSEQETPIELIEFLNRELLPYEQVEKCFIIKQIPLTALGKINTSELKKLIV